MQHFSDLQIMENLAEEMNKIHQFKVWAETKMAAMACEQGLLDRELDAIKKLVVIETAKNAEVKKRREDIAEKKARLEKKIEAEMNRDAVLRIAIAQAQESLHQKLDNFSAQKKVSLVF